ncbi:glycoside hydrolase family 10 protein [Lutimonas sp.]|uniref:glycoside hydrolase family 10 protein n=1 Tax=Lutimonas sp. TaxID=1872403 RepID=UPI003D9BF56E
MRILLIILFVFLQFHDINSQESLSREFRGVWVATVGNIDWPSAKDLSTQEQQKEIINLLDLFKGMNFNAVVFQIRPSADAFYKSQYEPWSYYLSGTNNKAPSPYYDPLAFIISETHKRGMEFHAWLNPYRALVNISEYRSNPFPLTYEKPEWFINYGKNKYFDPGLPEVRTYTNKVVADIVLNYDIDAIHFDDYFYPYKINGEKFEDERSFKRHGGAFYPDKKDDWRRENVNIIIAELHHTIKSLKPWVQFGISPFGVWRNTKDDQRGSNTEAGQTNYDDLYADIMLWMKNGWLDYVLPQAYWRIGHDKVDYKTIVEWWADNSFGTKLYIGHAMYRLAVKSEDQAWNMAQPTEIESQLIFNKRISQVKGSVFFSAQSFQSNPYKINQTFEKKIYQHPILQPIADKKMKFSPQAVRNLRLTKLKNKQYLLQWDRMPEHIEYQAVKYLVYLFDGNEAPDINQNAKIIALTGEASLLLSKKRIKSGQRLTVVAVSKNNDMSSPVSIQL